MIADPPTTLTRAESNAWLVPLAVTVAIIAGAAVAGTIIVATNPSGTVQSTQTTSIGEQLETQNVSTLFGAPYAALAAALVSYFGLRRPYPKAYAMIGIGAGVLVFAIVGFSAHAIGEWWVSSVPSDTNRAAALFSFLLVPPGALSAQLAVSPSTFSPKIRPRGVAARSILVGVMLGLILGSLLGSVTAGLTWAINCPQNGYTNCFSLSSVVSSALLIGAVAGMAIGAVTGAIAWRLRPRQLAS